ncbi:MAG: diguanylate cyclase, partial [Clostridiales bacterium]|nr:diguanylate cyclase [Clostridiales bacterium]
GFYCEIIEDVISVNCSIGIAILDEGRKNYEQIIADADEAMYKIKKSGKSRFGYL